MGIHKRTYTAKNGAKRTVYRVRWLEAGISGEQAYRSKQFDKRADADRFFRSKQAQRDERRAYGREAVLTLEDLWNEYLRVVGAGWQPSTKAGYTAVWNNYLKPALGSRTLAEFQESSRPLQELINFLKAARSGFGVGAGTERKTVGLLGMMLREATNWNLIVGHRCTPAPRQLQSQRRQREPELISLPQIELMRRYITSRRVGSSAGLTAHQLNLRDNAMLAVLAYAGLRPAEMLGLRRSDWKRETHSGTLGHLQVERQCVNGVERPIKNHRSTRAAVRTVPATFHVAMSVREWLLASPATGGDDAPMFPSSSGGLWSKTSWRNWTQATFREAAAAAGISPKLVRPYDLRTSWCYMLVLAGTNLVEAAKLAGHTTQVAYSYYVRATTENLDLGIAMLPGGPEVLGLELIDTIARSLERENVITIPPRLPNRAPEVVDAHGVLNYFDAEDEAADDPEGHALPRAQDWSEAGRRARERHLRRRQP